VTNNQVLTGIPNATNGLFGGLFTGHLSNAVARTVQSASSFYLTGTNQDYTAGEGLVIDSSGAMAITSKGASNYLVIPASGNSKLSAINGGINVRSDSIGFDIPLTNASLTGVSATGTFTGGGAGLTNVNWLYLTIGKSNTMFGAWTPGTTTEGFQEALNSLPYNQVTNGLATGGKIVVGPGNYYVTNTLDLTNRFLTSIIMEGAGEIASVVHYTGSAMGATATGLVGSPDGARLHLYVRDLGFIMDQNVTNAWFDLREWATVSFQNCFFSYNGYTTNSQWGISPASSIPDPVTYPKKAGGVHLWYSNENNSWFHQCHFNGLAYGINASAAHLFVDDCEFVDIGDYNGGSTNGWPITFPALSISSSPVGELSVLAATGDKLTPFAYNTNLERRLVIPPPCPLNCASGPATPSWSHRLTGALPIAPD